MEDHIEAHKFCSNNMPMLKKDKVCGCFYCLEIFDPAEIKFWIIANNPADDNPADKLGTAVCPHCGIDSVIGESSGYPITKDFLTKMKNYWF